MDITAALVESAAGPSPWDLGNDVLYGLCRAHPDHQSASAVVAKTWLIGRSYAAAIERRRNKTVENDDFYITVVAPGISSSGIDQWLHEIKSIAEPTDDTSDQIVRVHGRVTALFEQLTGLEKRSLASKYLHFHLPHLFFIYDARAVKGLQRLRTVAGRASAVRVQEADGEYRKFFQKCLRLRRHVEREFGILLSPRAIDNLLLKVSPD